MSTNLSNYGYILEIKKDIHIIQIIMKAHNNSNYYVFLEKVKVSI